MNLIHRVDVCIQRNLSPHELYDRCLKLADEADRAGFPVAAEHLFHIAVRVIDDPASLSDLIGAGSDSTDPAADHRDQSLPGSIPPDRLS